MTRRNFYYFLALAAIGLSAFSLADHSDDKSKALLKALKKANGGWSQLASNKDVQYTYTYNDFGKGKDVSTERYIFDGEASWGEYNQHEVHVMPGTEGVVRQCIMNGQPKITHNGAMVSDPEAIGGTEFLRTVNFFWFSMMYKLDDPGTSHKYMGQEEVNGILYDKVSLTYDPVAVGKEVNDEYILYFNPKTHLIDQFMFSVPAMGVNDPILKMELDYTKINNTYIATTRRAYAPGGDGGFTQMGEYTSENIKFNNGFTQADFKI